MVKSFAAPSGACDRFASRPVSRRLLSGLIALFALAFGSAAQPSFAAPKAVLTPSKTAATVAVDRQTEPAVLSTLQALDGLSPQLLDRALSAVACARARGVAGKSDLLTLIDYSLPSTAPRLWVIDLANRKVLFHELVAHGAGSGDNYATHFSNLDGSRATSLGLYLTRGTYEGGNGLSLRLEGLDAGVNDHALARQIVMHGAWYVSPDQIKQYGRIGRSWGCPALSREVAQQVIDTIKGGSFLYAYAADPSLQLASSGPSCGGPKAPEGATTVAAGGLR